MAQTTTPSRVWRNTGCSSSLGLALAARVLASGCRGIATTRNPATLAELAARFAGMDGSILTPHECVDWDGLALHFTPGVPRSAAPDEDAK